MKKSKVKRPRSGRNPRACPWRNEPPRSGQAKLVKFASATALAVGIYKLKKIRCNIDFFILSFDIFKHGSLSHYFELSKHAHGAGAAPRAGRMFVSFFHGDYSGGYRVWRSSGRGAAAGFSAGAFLYARAESGHGRGQQPRTGGGARNVRANPESRYRGISRSD